MSLPKGECRQIQLPAGFEVGPGGGLVCGHAPPVALLEVVDLFRQRGHDRAPVDRGVARRANGRAV
jgi:hypothetical protein